MAQILEMPRLSDTMQEGRIIKWHKKEGDKVAPGDVLAEIETDKANMDFEAFDEGVLLKIAVPDGGVAPVGGPVAILGAAGEDVSDLLGKIKSGAKSAPAPAPAAAPPRPPAAAPATAPARVTAAPATAPAPVTAAPATAPVTATAPTTATVPATATAPAAPPASAGPRIVASPLARRIAAERGIDLRTVHGSGPGGRIVKQDVESWQAAPAPSAGPAPAAAPSQLSAPTPTPAPVPIAGAADAEQPLSLMRKTIARRLTEAKRDIPHFYLTVEADMDAAVQFRVQVNQALGVKMSYNDLIIKACALALRRVPQVNASFADDRIIVHGGVHIGVAVALEDGLITPVVRDADSKSLGAIAREVAELAGRARQRKLKPAEYTGGTFSVSNLGMFGIEEFTAVINPPEAAILAVGALAQKPVVKDDELAIGHRMRLTLSCDHRAIDGATGARFLQEVLRILEHPMTLAM